MYIKPWRPLLFCSAYQISGPKSVMRIEQMATAQPSESAMRPPDSQCPNDAQSLIFFSVQRLHGFRQVVKHVVSGND